MQEYRSQPLRTLGKLKAAHAKGLRDLKSGSSHFKTLQDKRKPHHLNQYSQEGGGSYHAW